MDFGKAIEALKEGKKVARVGWNGKNMFLFLATDKDLTDCICNDDMPPCVDSICMETAQNTIVVGWLASQTDMLAEDTFGTKARNKIDDFFYTLALIPDATSQMFDGMMNDGGIFNPDSKFWENWHTGFEDIKSSLNNFGEWYEASFKSIFGSVGEWWVSFWEGIGAKVFNFK